MQDKRSFFSQIFTSLMIFSLLVGICTVAFITSWPWEKSAPVWQPSFRLVASCGEQACGVAWSELAQARAEGRVTAIEPTETAGEVEETQNWLKWLKQDGLYEVKASSWHFQTTVRYKIDNGEPVLVAYQDIDVAKAFTYGIGAAVFMMFGLYLRRLRQ